MADRESREQRAKDLLAQDPEVNETNLKEFRMSLEATLAEWELRTARMRKGIVIAAISYLFFMIVLVVGGAASNSMPTGLLRSVYLALAMTAMAASWISLIAGAWMVLTYFYRYSPSLKRARFDAHTVMIQQLQHQVEALERRLDEHER